MSSNLRESQPSSCQSRTRLESRGCTQGLSPTPIGWPSIPFKPGWVPSSPFFPDVHPCALPSASLLSSAPLWSRSLKLERPGSGSVLLGHQRILKLFKVKLLSHTHTSSHLLSTISTISQSATSMVHHFPTTYSSSGLQWLGEHLGRLARFESLLTSCMTLISH